MPKSLSNIEFSRYNRHILMPQIGVQGQEKLKAAKVLMIGAGGLGCPILQYLTAAGVGKIGIVDFDTVDLSNLQRQILFTTEDIGNSKVEVAKKRLLSHNPNIEIETYNVKITSENIFSIIEHYDIIIDGTDNFPTRYLVNDACVLKNKINVFGSIFQFEGQVAVFNYPNDKGIRSANYRDIFPNPPKDGTVPNCAEAGVFGVLPGIIGSIQASEVIKIITGVGEPLASKLLILDTLSFTTRVLNINKNPKTEIRQLIDYNKFCGVENSTKTKINTISASGLKELIDKKEDYILIDVRHPHEHEFRNIGGILIPQEEIIARKNEIPKNKNVIFYCESGHRSGLVIQKLNYLYGYTNLFNLEGGILKWNF